jgi:hypothetical protein
MRRSLVTARPLNFLVLAGPTTAALSSRGMTRPAVIAAVYLFDAARLAEQRARGVKGGVFSSVLNAQWQAADTYPTWVLPRGEGLSVRRRRGP